MYSFKLFIPFALFVFLCGCQSSTTGKATIDSPIDSSDHKKTPDSSAVPADEEMKINVSGNIAAPDISGLKHKRDSLFKHFDEENPMTATGDTLFDLNYDGHEDYIIRSYGKSGTGIKNGMEVYLFDKGKQQYIRNKQLSDLANPTFYLSKKKITGFYIGLGGGHGKQYEWINGKWRIAKEFDVKNEDDKTIWIVHYRLLHKQEIITHAFQMIPPDEVLETDIDF